MKKYIAKMSGWETELTRGEYTKLCRRTRGGGALTGAWRLENGDLINLAGLNGIVVIGEDEPEEVKADIEPAVVEPEEGADETPEPPKEDKPPAMTKDEFLSIYEDSGLDYAAFAERIGYSPVTVRMAVKEGKVTPPMAAKIREVFTK